MRGVQQFLFPEFDDLNIKIKDVDYVDISTISVDLVNEKRKHKYELLPKDKFMPYMKQHLQYIVDHQDDKDRHKFSELEYEKFRRVVDYMESTHYTVEKLTEGRRDFYQWFTEYDRRRNVNFVETFPELEEFYFDCAGV